MRLTRRDLLLAAATLPLSSMLGSASAQNKFPSTAVKLVVPFSPGGAADILARIFADHMSSTVGQPIVVENKTGAGGVIGAQAVARANPDGHTMLLNGNTLITQQHLNENAEYDFRTDFTPVSLLVKFPIVLVVHPSLPVENVEDFLKYAREKGSSLFYGSAGPGSTQHFVGELFNRSIGTNMQHVPYRGSGLASAALMAGDIQVFFDIVPTAATLGAAGKVRTLAVTSKTRSPSLPDLPALSETILPGYDATFWHALFLPKGADRAIVEQWLHAVKVALADKKVQARMQELGFEPVGSSPEELANHMQKESDKWAKLISDADVKI